jgi:hypothetical protein
VECFSGLGNARISGVDTIEVTNIEKINMVSSFERAEAQLVQSVPEVFATEDLSDELQKKLTDVAHNEEGFRDNTRPYSTAIALGTVWYVWFYDNFTMHRAEEYKDAVATMYTRPMFSDDMPGPFPVYRAMRLPVYPEHRSVLSMTSAYGIALRMQRGDETSDVTIKNIEYIMSKAISTGVFFDSVMEKEEIVCSSNVCTLVLRGQVYN